MGTKEFIIGGFEINQLEYLASQIPDYYNQSPLDFLLQLEEAVETGEIDAYEITLILEDFKPC